MKAVEAGVLEGSFSLRVGATVCDTPQHPRVYTEGQRMEMRWIIMLNAMLMKVFCRTYAKHCIKQSRVVPNGY